VSHKFALINKEAVFRQTNFGSLLKRHITTCSLRKQQIQRVGKQLTAKSVR